LGGATPQRRRRHALPARALTATPSPSLPAPTRIEDPEAPPNKRSQLTRGTFVRARRAGRRGHAAEAQTRQAAGNTRSNTTIGAGMTHYVDGFVFPIPRDRLGEYQRLAKAAAEIWKEHGALDYCEYVGDDLKLDGTRSFLDIVDTAENEVIVFGWVAFESREARDLANEKVATDPRMANLIDASNSGFVAKRMAYGGFERFV
ncbi:MAG: DUF1428 domain-containing protein, partial [Gemmatimonadota bacterium]